MEGYITVIIILSIISVYFITRFLWLEAEIRRLNRYIEKVLRAKPVENSSNIYNIDGEDAGIITCTIGDRNYERLAQNINRYIKKKRIDRNIFLNREREFKMEIANISHDLRTPLTTILGYMELLEATLKDEFNNTSIDNQKEIWSYIDIIERRSKNLQNLIEQFYEYSKLNDINYSLELEEVNVNTILSEHLLSYYQDFENKLIGVEVDMSEKPVFAIGTEDAIGRIINNFISNSLKYARDSLRVVLREDKEYVYIDYMNRTEYMTEYDMQHIFDRFFMTDKSRNHNSSGLGLTISRLLANKMGGDVYAKYDEPWFTITVQLKKVEILH